MADLSVTPIGTSIKPVQQISLADMVNIARGAQAYQGGEIELEQKDIANQEQRRVAEAVKQNPNLFMTDNRLDIDKVNRIIPQLAPRTQATYLQTYNTLHKAQTDAIQAKANLSQDLKTMVGSRYSVLGRAGIPDPAAYIAEGELMKKEYPDIPDLHRYIDAANTSFKLAQPGPSVAQMAIRGAETLLTPAQQQTAFAPGITTQDGKTTITQPSVSGQMPTSTVGIAGGIQQTPTATSAVPAGAQIAPGMRVPYPVRSAAQPYIPEPSEAKDQAAGEEYRTGLVNRQGNLVTDRRNVEEALKAAKNLEMQLYRKEGGILQDIERKIRMAVNSDEYKLLSKDLANLQISNMRALGNVGNTVAGIDLTRVASGDETIPPKVLQQIIRRTQADMTNIDMQAKGAQVFKQQYGDNNMKAYQQAWNANADSKIFEAINITRDVADPAQREKELKKLFPDERTRAEFLTKYRNLKKLSETGSL